MHASDQFRPQIRRRITFGVTLRRIMQFAFHDVNDSWDFRSRREGWQWSNSEKSFRVAAGVEIRSSGYDNKIIRLLENEK